jgi:hypothetical protein
MCRLKERPHQLLVAGRGFQSNLRLDFQVQRIIGNVVRQVAIFGLAPGRLHGIQIRCISRQPLEHESIIIAQASGRRPVRRQTIHHHDQWAANLSLHITDERLDFRRLDVLLVDGEVESDPVPLRGNRQPGDHAQPVVTIPALHDRPLAQRRPGATH